MGSIKAWVLIGILYGWVWVERFVALDGEAWGCATKRCRVWGGRGGVYPVPRGRVPARPWVGGTVG